MKSLVHTSISSSESREEEEDSRDEEDRWVCQGRGAEMEALKGSVTGHHDPEDMLKPKGVRNTLGH